MIPSLPTYFIRSLFYGCLFKFEVIRKKKSVLVNSSPRAPDPRATEHRSRTSGASYRLARVRPKGAIRFRRPGEQTAVRPCQTTGLATRLSWRCRTAALGNLELSARPLHFSREPCVSSGLEIFHFLFIESKPSHGGSV
jgi:hypothetical protein